MDPRYPFKLEILPAGNAGRVVFGAAFVVLYVGLDWVSYVYPIAGFAITPWSPPAGLSLAVLLLIGPRAIPLVFVSGVISDFRSEERRVGKECRL